MALDSPRLPAGISVVVVVVDCPFGRGGPGDVAYWLWRALKAATKAATTSLRRISSVVGRMLPTAGMRRRTPIIPAQVIRMCRGVSASSPHRWWSCHHISVVVSALRHHRGRRALYIWAVSHGCRRLLPDGRSTTGVCVRCPPWLSVTINPLVR